MSIKSFISAVFFLFFFSFSWAQTSYPYQTIPSFSEEVLQSRISQIHCQIPLKYDATVKAYINTYTVRKREMTGRIIGRAQLYFPIFESALIRHNAPTDLKFLPIVESALNPSAVSRAGARGLWQFMPATGREYDLHATNYVDDRSDPHKSSEAAARMLSNLYRSYGDWALALAAYNSGPGRVNRAIRAAKSRNFWKVKKYLPKETRGYVPAFVAATYVYYHYHDHNIIPQYLDFDEQVTTKLRIFHGVSFKEVSLKTGIPLDRLKFLNPTYYQDFIPTDPKGHVIYIPQSKESVFRTARPDAVLESHFQAGIVTGPPATMVSEMKRVVKEVKSEKIHVVKKGQTLGHIAMKYNCSVSSLKRWNGISGTTIRIGQKIKIVSTIEEVVYESILVPIDFEQTIAYNPPPPAPVPSTYTIKTKKYPTVGKIPEMPISRVSEQPPAYSSDIHILGANETLMEISKKYQIRLEDIIKWNNLSKTDLLVPGLPLKVRPANK